jgi:hypothetical protein
MKIISVFCILSFLCLPLHLQAAESLELSVPGKKIQLPEQSWSLMNDQANYAQTYEQKEISASHKDGRVVTVFLEPMPDKRKVGARLADNEYLEIVIIEDGFVTAQVKVDKGKYWVACRETFLPKPRLSVDVSSHKAFLSELAKMSLWMDYQPEIEETRALLQTIF